MVLLDSTVAPEPHLADALTRAERRLAKLERLSDIGMELAEQVGAHTAAAMAAVNEDKGGNPARAFATLSRSIRLTLALEARVDAQILALRNGRVPPGWACGAPAPRDPGVGATASGGEVDATLRPARENLVDRETFEDFELGAFRDTDRSPRSGEDRPQTRPPSPSWGGPTREASGVGESGSSPRIGGEADFPTPDFAALRLDPPHVGGGRMSDP